MSSYGASRGRSIVECRTGKAEPGSQNRKAGQAFLSAYLLVSTIGICEDSCKLIRRSIRRSIWYHNAVFLGETTFSNTATYLNRKAMSSSSTAANLLM